MLLTLLLSSGWERFMLQVWWVWMFCGSWPRCTTSAGQWCAATYLMSEFSRPHGPTTSTWACCCLCCSSACCLLSTLSWPCRRPLTVGHSGQWEMERAESLFYMIVKYPKCMGCFSYVRMTMFVRWSTTTEWIVKCCTFMVPTGWIL